MRPFVEEPYEKDEERFGLSIKLRFRVKTILLLVSSLIGLLAQSSLVFYPRFRMDMLFPAISWLFVCLMVAIRQPWCTPKSALIIISSILLSQLLVFSGGVPYHLSEKVGVVLVISSAVSAITVILLMPMRDPRWKNDQISAAFEPSTSKLRSPEDNLTLWQFMTVSWMTPLISVGNSRQINDEDVWTLSYEFQHRFLHDRFTNLGGSLWTRLFIANGMDLVRISLLSFIELFASK